MGALDRDGLAKLIAGQVAPAVESVYLPKLGVDVHLLTELGQANKVRIGAYAAGGDADDVEVRGIIATIRYLLVDEEAKPLLRSITEAVAFIDTLDDEDFAAIGEALRRLNIEHAEVEVDEGKESSSPVPGS